MRRGGGRGAVLAVALSAALVATLWRGLAGDPLTDRIERALIDLRFLLRGVAAAPESVAVVAVDEAAARAMATPEALRRGLTEATLRLDAAGAAAIAIAFVLEARTEADEALAAALAGSGRAALAVGAVAAPAGTRIAPAASDALDRAGFRIVYGRAGSRAADARAVLPAAPLDEAAALGHVALLRAEDRAARRAPLALSLGGAAPTPSLALVAARIGLGLPPEALRLRPGRAVELGDRTIETDDAGEVVIDHYGPSGAIATVPIGALLDGSADVGRLRGRVVFLGATAESLGSLFATPFDSGAPGVEILATAAANAMGGGFPRAGGAAVAAGAALALLGALAGSAAARLRPAPLAALACLGALVAVAGAAQALFVSGRLLIDATTPLAATALAAAASWALRTRAADRSRAVAVRERDRVAAYLSPLAARSLLAPSGGGERSGEAAVVFVDMIGSTAAAEGLDAAETTALYRTLQRRIGTVSETHGGAVAERQGDGALVVFGPGPPAEVTAGAALAFGRALAGEESRVAGRSVRFRVSAAFGPVVVVDLGGHITVAGDTVNLASRLQDVAKARGAGFVADDRLAAAAGQADPAALEETTVRGRAGVVRVWRAA